MSKVYKKYGATADGYRGQRAILSERVIEGLEQLNFTDSVLQLNPDSPKTVYLTDSNMVSGGSIILPNAQNLWNNWQVSIINESSADCSVYYYTSDLSQLNLFKEVTAGNMVTCILLNDSTEQGNWTTLRTTERATVDNLNKYTSNVLEELVIDYTKLKQDVTSIDISLGNVLKGTSLKSTYIKLLESFTGSTTLKVSIGIPSNHTKFSQEYDLMTTVSDSNFTKDLFDEILSTTNDTEIFAYFTGTGLDSLTAGSVQLIVEKAKEIDPTILKNPIIQTQIPIGIIMNYAFTDVNNKAPSGYWRLDGSILPNAASAAPQFVQKLVETNDILTGEKLIVGSDEWNSIYNTYGSCGKFTWVGSGLRFPAINCFIQGLSTLEQLSALTPAGLPNITGNFNQLRGASAYGAFEMQSAAYQGSWEHAVNRSYDQKVNFDASRSSSVYGKSNTVTPLNIKYPYIISVYNKIQLSSELILDEIIEDSINKANISLDNLNTVGKNFIGNVCMPDYENQILITGVPLTQWTKVLKNSFVCVWAADPNAENFWVLVSPDASENNYVVGRRYDDFTANTQETSFTFFVPAGWYFLCSAESGYSGRIYPLKGAI